MSSSSSSYTATTTTAHNAPLILRLTTPEHIRAAQDQADMPTPVVAEPAVVTQANRTREAASSMIIYLVQNSNKIGIVSGAANVLCGAGMMAAGTGMYFLPSLFSPLAGMLPTVVTDGIGITGVAAGAGTAGLGIAQIINSLGLRNSPEAEQFATLFKTFADEALRLNANIQAESNRLESSLTGLQEQLAEVSTHLDEIQMQLKEQNQKINKTLQSQSIDLIDIKTKLANRIQLAEKIKEAYQLIQERIGKLSENDSPSAVLGERELQTRMDVFSSIVESLSVNQRQHCELEQINTDIITTQNHIIQERGALLIQQMQHNNDLFQSLELRKKILKECSEQAAEATETAKEITNLSKEQEALLKENKKLAEELRSSGLITESEANNRFIGALATAAAGFSVGGPLGALAGAVTGYWAAGRGQRIYGAVAKVRCKATGYMKSRVQHGTVTYGYDINSSGYGKSIGRGVASTVNFAGSFFRAAPVVATPDTASSTRGTIEIEIAGDLIQLAFNFQHPIPIDPAQFLEVCKKVLQKVEDGVIDKETAAQILKDLMHPLEDPNQRGRAFVNEDNEIVKLYLSKIAEAKTVDSTSSTSVSAPATLSEVDGFTVV